MSKIEGSINGKDLSEDEIMVISIALHRYRTTIKFSREEMIGGKKMSFDESLQRYHMDIIDGILEKWKDVKNSFAENLVGE